MPNCFTLTKIGENEPTRFVEVDNEICEHFGVEPHPEYFYHDWYDTIGLLLALGKSFEEIKVSGFSEKTVKIVEFLETRYTSSAWYQPKF